MKLGLPINFGADNSHFLVDMPIRVALLFHQFKSGMVLITSENLWS